MAVVGQTNSVAAKVFLVFLLILALCLIVRNNGTWTVGLSLNNDISDWKLTNNNDWDLKQLKRRLRITEKCLNHPPQQLPCDLNSILSDDIDKVLFCFIPKAACSSWKSAILRLSNNFSTTVLSEIHDMNVLKSHGLQTLAELTPEERNFRLGSYKKFLFVRDPLQRLVSAYRDKFESGQNKAFNLGYGKEIIKLYRKNASDHALDTGSDVTFSEFVHFVVDGHSDPHWSSFHHRCCMCQIHYDVIAKMESMFNDSVQIFTQFFKHSEKEVSQYLPNLNPNTRGRTNSSLVKQYLELLSAKDRNALLSHVMSDFSMFGYDIKKYM